jgi:hypothetical protein
MSKRFIIVADHGHGPVYFCSGGGAFSWWTVHRSMASKFTAEAAKHHAWYAKGQVVEVAPEPVVG